VADFTAKKQPKPGFCPWCGKTHQACLNAAMERLMEED
jgi:hypothetical protein